MFLESSGRWISALLLGALGGFMFLERKISTPAACDEQPFCKQCVKLKGCQKPQALSYVDDNGKALNKE
jgi:hypothetical protein